MRKPVAVTGVLLFDQRFWGSTCFEKGIGLRPVFIEALYNTTFLIWQASARGPSSSRHSQTSAWTSSIRCGAECSRLLPCVTLPRQSASRVPHSLSPTVYSLSYCLLSPYLTHRNSPLAFAPALGQALDPESSYSKAAAALDMGDVTNDGVEKNVTRFAELAESIKRGELVPAHGSKDAKKVSKIKRAGDIVKTINRVGGHEARMTVGTVNLGQLRGRLPSQESKRVLREMTKRSSTRSAATTEARNLSGSTRSAATEARNSSGSRSSVGSDKLESVVETGDAAPATSVTFEEGKAPGEKGDEEGACALM